MKNMMKTIAMLSLSACVLVGGAVSSFAAESTSHYSANILYHQADDCEGTARAEIVVQFSSPYGATNVYTICAECGDVNGKSGLTKVNNATANFGGLEYEAMQNVSASVMLPASSVEGYDLYLVNTDGSETKLEVSSDGQWAHMDVYMADGAALIRMVSQS